MELRRQHRIIYQTKIRMRSPGRDDSVIARVQNLSPHGMFVTATDLPDPGTEVQCRLTLGGERRTLRGRVAWVRPPSAATPLKSPGAGIEFVGLDERDSELLTRLVEPSDERRQPVEVWFEGMPSPVRCQALVVGEGLRLETRLPFMRLRSEVKVAFSGRTPPLTREGVVEGVSLEPSPEDGVPFLRLEVALPPLDSARGVIEEAGAGPRVPDDGGAPLASTVVDPAVVGAGPLAKGALPLAASGPDRDVTHRIGVGDVTPPPAATPTPGPTPKPRGGSGLLLLGLFVGAGLAAGGAWLAWPRAGLDGQRLPPGGLVGVAANHLPRTFGAPAVSATAAAGATPASAANAPTRAGELPAAATAETTPGASPSAPAAVAASAPAADPNAPGPTGAVVVPSGTAAAGPPSGVAAEAPGGDVNETAEIEPLPLPASPHADKGVGLSVEGDRVLISLALTGDTGGAEEVRYLEPPGVGIMLPRARPTGGLVNLAFKEGPVRLLARKRGSAGSHVRFLFDTRKYQGKLAVVGENLHLSLIRR